MEKWLMIIAVSECVVVGISLISLITTTYFTLKNEKQNDKLIKQNDEVSKFVSSYKDALTAIQWGYNNCSERLKKLESKEETHSLLDQVDIAKEED